MVIDLLSGIAHAQAFYTTGRYIPMNGGILSNLNVEKRIYSKIFAGYMT
jgi:hypothetical protein